MTNTQTIQKNENSPVTRRERTRSNPCFQPHVDILERADELMVLADMPGVSANDVDIQFENGTLTIDGRVTRTGPANRAFLLHEYGVGDYHRSFRVSDAIDAARITAECRDGVLTIRLPKTAGSIPRRIPVTAAGLCDA